MNNLERLAEAAQIANSIERRSEKLTQNTSMPDANTEIAHALKETAHALHLIVASIPK
jgi:hypothetical protein